MATPITWQNVNGPSLAEASRPLDSAARAFDMGFGALRGVLDQRNQIVDQNWKQGTVNNTNLILDKVAGLTSVDQARAAQQADMVGQLKASMGAQVDGAAVRGALDQRLTGLMQQQKQSIEFDNILKDERSHPFMQAYKAAVQAGDQAGMQKAIKGYEQAGGRNLPDLMEYATNTGWQKEQRGEERTQWGRNAEAHTDNMLSGKVNRQTALGQLAVSQRNAAVNERQATVQEANAIAAQAERLENRLSQFRKERAETFKGQASSVEGQTTIQDFIKGLEDKDDQKQARLAASRALKENPNATTASVLRGLGGMNTTWYSPDWYDRGLVVDDIAAATKGGAGSAEVTAAEERRNAVDGRINATKTALDRLAGSGAGVISMPPARVAATPAVVANPTGMAAPAKLPGQAQTVIADGSPEEKQLMAEQAQRVQQQYGMPPPPPDYAAMDAAKGNPAGLRELAERTYQTGLAEHDKKFKGAVSPESLATLNSLRAARADALEAADRADGGFWGRSSRGNAMQNAAREKAEAKAQAREDRATKRQLQQQLARQEAAEEKQDQIRELEQNLKIYTRRGTPMDIRRANDVKKELERLQRG